MVVYGIFLKVKSEFPVQSMTIYFLIENRYKIRISQKWVFLAEGDLHDHV